MLTQFSKPAADIAIEADSWSASEAQRLAQQCAVAQHLRQGEPRVQCLLCTAALADAQAYRHRKVDYLVCARCGHLQTRLLLPEGYPHQHSGQGFDVIYPALDVVAYQSRRDRIYTPKLDWMLSALAATGTLATDAVNAAWLEVGCGAGYFLSALQTRGIRRIAGIDANAGLVAEANRQCLPGLEGASIARVSDNLFDDLANSDADIIAAFFVLEHIDPAMRFWEILAAKPTGTVFAFAVPSFGLATLMEGAFDDFSARNLDNVVHTQLYTDESIDYALGQAGYRKIAEWLFGQDAQDLCRLLIQRIATRMDRRLVEQTAARLTALIDPLQQAIDHARLCDARHILAVRD